MSLRLVKKAPRQLELTWAGSRSRSPGGNLSYELHVLNQVRTRLNISSVCAWTHPTFPSLGCRMGEDGPQ